MEGRRLGILIDVDGTAYRGYAAFWTYGEEMAALLPKSARADLEQAVKELLDGGEGVPNCPDLWWGLTRLGQDRGLSFPALDRAFEAVRTGICEGKVEVQVPPGLAEFLDWADEAAQIAFATNSAGQSARRLLAYLGLSSRIRPVVGHAGKPAGMAAVRRQLFADLKPSQCVSVGDNYPGDVASALRLGMRAVHVAWPGTTTGPADVHVQRLEEALPWLGKLVEQGAAA